jgi:hypothetical protein
VYLGCDSSWDALIYDTYNISQRFVISPEYNIVLFRLVMDYRSLFATPAPCSVQPGQLIAALQWNGLGQSPATFVFNGGRGLQLLGDAAYRISFMWPTTATTASVRLARDYVPAAGDTAMLDRWSTTSSRIWPQQYNTLLVRLDGCTPPISRLTWPVSPLASGVPLCEVGRSSSMGADRSQTAAIPAAFQRTLSAVGLNVTQDLLVVAVAIELLWTVESEIPSALSRSRYVATRTVRVRKRAPTLLK